jgi:DNA-binding transcriptional MerR regulator
LSALAGAILGASSVYPVNAVARAVPSDRTIRFYISRGLVSPPEGRGTSAIYMYRHLLQVLAIKLRQMEGATLDTIRQELDGLAGDVVERRVAAALGPALPDPEALGWTRRRVPATADRLRSSGSVDPSPQPVALLVRRIPIAPGCELLIDAGHPFLRGRWSEDEFAATLRRLLSDRGKE